MQRGLTFDDVLLVPTYSNISSRSLVDVSTSLGDFKFDIPVVSANMDTITGRDMAAAMAKSGGLALLHRFQTIQENVDMFNETYSPNNVGISIGLGEEGLTRAEALWDVGVKIVCVDVAHGHSEAVRNQIINLKNRYKNSIYIIAGNVATRDGAVFLEQVGADAVKVGVGPGSVCTTRIKTGCGVPQLTAIMEAVDGVRIPVIADGGMKTSGDVVKALAAGASMVMLGGMLAGTDETPGEIERDYKYKTGETGLYKIYEGPRYKQYRGSASKESYVDQGKDSAYRTAEGESLRIECKGSVKAVLQDLIGGLRSGMTYCGATNLAALVRNADFLEVSHATQVENNAHAIGRNNK